MRMLGIGALACAACGRIGFGSTTDGGSTDPDAVLDARPDAAVDAAMFGPFGVPTVIPMLSSNAVSDDDPTLTGDLLEIFFISDRVGGPGLADIWFSTRTSTTGFWSAPVPAPGLNSTSEEDNCAIALDGLTIWFSSQRGGPGLELWTSTRPTRGSAWTTPVLVPELNTAQDDNGAAVSSSQLRMLLNGGPTPARDLYETTRPTTAAAWSTASPITSLNTAAHEGSAIYVTDLEVWFTSNRAGGLGGHDLYVATRPTVTSPFDAPTAVSGVNSTVTDDDAWLSPDGRTLVFSSNRSGTDDLYQATR